MSTEHCSFNGTQLAKILRQEFKIEVEMETEQYVIAMAAVGDTEEGFLRLCEAIQTIDEREAAILKVEDKRTEYDFRWEEKKQFMRISQAMDASVCALSFRRKCREDFYRICLSVSTGDSDSGTR
mgnify:CR=1 FL=1